MVGSRGTSYVVVAMTTDPYDVPERAAALGLVVDEDRGALPYALVHGESLVAAAAWALGEAGVTPVDTGTPWAELVEAELPLVLHDPLCPMTPPDFIAGCVDHATAHACVVVGVRPVTDTVKVVADGFVGETLDRTGLVSVASPVVLPPAVVAALDGPPPSDLVALVAELRRRYPVELVEAPPYARRVGSEEDLGVLEALTAT